jgi:hypothetical protein
MNHPYVSISGADFKKNLHDLVVSVMLPWRYSDVTLALP